MRVEQVRVQALVRVLQVRAFLSTFKLAMHESLRFYAIAFHHIVAVGRHLCCQIGRTLCAERPSLALGTFTLGTRELR